MTRRSTDIVAGPGGVMTDEAGVITGELTLATELTRSQVVVKVQYRGAAEWYTVTGASAKLASGKDLDALHTVAVALLNRPDG